MPRPSTIIDVDYSTYRDEAMVLAYVIERGFSYVAKAPYQDGGNIGEGLAVLMALREVDGPAVIRCDCLNVVRHVNDFVCKNAQYAKIYAECQQLMREKWITVIYRERSDNPAHTAARMARTVVGIKSLPDMEDGAMKVRSFAPNRFPLERVYPWYLVKRANGHTGLYRSFGNALAVAKDGDFIIRPFKKNSVTDHKGRVLGMRNVAWSWKPAVNCMSRLLQEAGYQVE